MIFKVSVIIPVFNTQLYIEKAILSALDQKEVAEVIVVDDGSTDDTSKILAKLENENSKIRTYKHSNGENRGRAFSRNLGIKMATSSFIAFLDADDYYLENRFQNDARLFAEDYGIDGVYNAIGVHFYRNASEEEKERLMLTTINYKIKSNELFDKMSPKGDAGHFHGNGLTVKREIFKKVGYFDNRLKVAEDTHMWIKMSLKAKLIAGILDRPVSIRGVHDSNVFHLYSTILYKRNMALMFNSLLKWAYSNQLKMSVLEYFYKNSYIYFKYLGDEEKFKHFVLLNWLECALKYPKLLKLKYFIYTNPLVTSYRKRLKS
ncbi:Glycosyl transferase family 2 [Gillisia sp. Hel1_33_143]|uniref:glycosyltransferase family 2 protein n=1 Tax=Gillisia sp. Hel1_33_143 TaxID=1336796 RepID=UPI00087A999A|nr:glycosyltransferase family 2 protein [Gillisia sp. Hel1_33_143]SDS23356.1 Glycosyl transferase family 2 [Gillisia sp. Hel1_33_143]